VLPTVTALGFFTREKHKNNKKYGGKLRKIWNRWIAKTN
jgi:hypothetical protein